LSCRGEQASVLGHFAEGARSKWNNFMYYLDHNVRVRKL
jgi:hypothetical protein